ncbi:unnamed protein product [Prorocentrum cordatum]|uniref:Transmembrane protein n=1 Tax=Prorocentrum cordatum TaxID=2364126 RepID=A0ABN9WLN0_9DINO|nr:unnamed protein product [Polarella glacialis]
MPNVMPPLYPLSVCGNHELQESHDTELALFLRLRVKFTAPLNPMPMVSPTFSCVTYAAFLEPPPTLKQPNVPLQLPKSLFNLLTLVLTPLVSFCTLYLFYVPTFAPLESLPILCMTSKPIKWPILKLAALASPVPVLCTLSRLRDLKIVSLVISSLASVCMSLPWVAIVFLPLLPMLLAFCALFAPELLAVRSILTKTFGEWRRAMRRAVLKDNRLFYRCFDAWVPVLKITTCMMPLLVANNIIIPNTFHLTLPLVAHVSAPKNTSCTMLPMAATESRMPPPMVANVPDLKIAVCMLLPLGRTTPT